MITRFLHLVRQGFPPTIGRIASVLAILVGIVALVALWFPSAPGMNPVRPRMTPTAGLALILSGIALGVLRQETHDRTRRLAEGCAAGASLIGLLTLADFFLDGSLGLNRSLAFVLGAGSSVAPVRSSFHTGLAFILLGPALLLLDARTQRGPQPAQCLALLAGHIFVVVLLGYLFNAPGAYRITSPPDGGMALGTALVGGLLCVGILFARPTIGFPAILLSVGGGGVLVRRFLIAPLLVPLIVVALRLALRSIGIDSELVAWLFALSYFVIFTAIIWWIASTIYRTEAARIKAEQRFRSVAETAHLAIITADGKGCIAHLNPATEAMFGYRTAEIIGRPMTFLIPEWSRTGEAAVSQSSPQNRAAGETRELTGRRRDGTEFPMEISLASWRVADEMFFTSILSDITERKRADESLKALNSQLSDANKELEAFSYSVSHDLRAPLRSIDGFARILMDDFAGQLPEEAQDHLRDVRDSARRMGQLVDDLLAFSRLGRQALKMQLVRPDTLVRQCLDQLRAEQSGRLVELNISNLPPCRGDAALLKQVWANLLSNALKYTRTKDIARIEIGSQAGENGEVTYFVRDNGVGFDMRYVHKLFGVFQRLHRTEEFEGTGVGLAIVQRVIHRHGGRVWADGRLGEGATFFFTLKGGNDE